MVRRKIVRPCARAFAALCPKCSQGELPFLRDQNDGFRIRRLSKGRMCFEQICNGHEKVLKVTDWRSPASALRSPVASYRCYLCPPASIYRCLVSGIRFPLSVLFPSSDVQFPMSSIHFPACGFQLPLFSVPFSVSTSTLSASSLWLSMSSF